MSAAAAPHLKIEQVTKRFGETEVLKDISLSIPKGAFVALLGPSGCGKSTLLKIIAGLEAPSGGSVHLGGQSLDGVPAYKRDIGVVFQSYALFPHMTVNDNVRFGLDMRAMPKAEAATRVGEALELVKLGGYGERMPSELSGGQQQRVALARSLAIRPRLLLLDEPLSNLDAVLRKSVRVDIRELHERVGATTVMVTHDQEEAMSMADTVAVMAEGRILQLGTPEAIYERPATRFVGGFVGNPPASLVRALKRFEGGWLFGDTIWRPEDRLAARMDRFNRVDLVVGLRPERIAIVAPDAPGALRAEVRSSEYLGGGRLVHLDLGGQKIAVEAAGAAPKTGTSVGLMPDAGAVMLFDAETGVRLERE
ncbi:ABC transporter ATP-binding protein [Kaistia dalseonensis]|uniref:ABC-type Fe3+/spermidine/putrescine transport system ATPase subunit n=1 Tax=Kaistia dalseonensis TaxID=410840 RepID=A0ABU0H8T0_9HYPH|nr:ABC transporter ATP-binding protein [Kaistia dalseonensis]MCX5495323.1 ABC transporter ATP-binding protein [Kaistia dalseonensis]MDQ0437909.1 ABC-type Fe3+/spermidine/putrescine transport system ATPase subunit [Kaistia dalseonensis]